MIAHLPRSGTQRLSFASWSVLILYLNTYESQFWQFSIEVLIYVCNEEQKVNSFSGKMVPMQQLPIFYKCALIVTLIIRDQVVIKVFSFIKKYPGCYQHPGRSRVLPILSHKKMTTTSNFLCAHFNRVESKSRK